MRLFRSLIVSAGLVVFAFGPAAGQDAGMKKWTKGKGWGWVWGQDDEVGALNEMTDAPAWLPCSWLNKARPMILGWLMIGIPTSGPGTAQVKS